MKRATLIGLGLMLLPSLALAKGPVVSAGVNLSLYLPILWRVINPGLTM